MKAGGIQADDVTTDAQPQRLSTSYSPLIAIVGETASGKSAVGLELGRRLNGEIIAADSWTVYKDFDIGTAKPSLAEQRELRHHMIDVADPSEGFNAASYKRLALQSIDDIESREKVAIMVGGTGLYVDSVLYDFSFMPAGDPTVRSALNELTIEQLISEIDARAISLEGIDSRNKRRLIRLLESGGLRPTNKGLRPRTLIIGLQVGRDQLHQNIEERVDTMLDKGLEHEVERLAARYGWMVEPMKGIGYREWREYFEGSQNLAQTRQRILQTTRQLAKRQRTWFKRNGSIQWVHDSREAVDLATIFLNK